MIDFDITKIKDEIKDLSYADKLTFLSNKSDALGSKIDELRSLIEELDDSIDEISTLFQSIQSEHNATICNSILQSLTDEGYDINLDSNSKLSFTLGFATFTIETSYLYDPIVEFSFDTEKEHYTLHKLISSILPEFKKDRYRYIRKVSEEEYSKCVVDVVDKLMGHKEEFEGIVDK